MTNAMIGMPSPNIFISYAHKDNVDPDPKKCWLDRLLEQLQPLNVQGLVKCWSDEELELGAQWHAEIQQALGAAKAGVLLVSPAFLASKYIRNSELPVLLNQARRNGALIIPIIVRRSLFAETKFKYPDPVHGPEELSLASFQSANPPDKPLIALSEDEQDQVFLSVAQRLLEISRNPAPAPAAMPVLTGLNPQTVTAGGPGFALTASGSNFANDSDVGARPPEEPGPGSKLKGAIETLVDLMHAPNIKAAVIQFQTDFQAASEQVELLGGYKELHDLLHELQYQCYDRLVREAGRFPDDELVRDNLSGYEATLRKTCLAVRRVFSTPRFAQAETAELQIELETAWGEVQNALETLERSSLEQATYGLFGILNFYPAKINSQLTEAARALRLQRLLNAMQTICARLNAPASAQGRQFQAGTLELIDLENLLQTYLSEHDKWQRVDGLLRQVRDTSSDFPMQIRQVHRQLKSASEAIRITLPETHADELKAALDRLEQQLRETELPRLRDAFLRYRRWAGWRFFEVDKELKNVCESLRLIGQPLAAILQLL